MNFIALITLVLVTSHSFANPVCGEPFTVNSLDEKVSIPDDLKVINNRENGEIVVTEPLVLIDGEKMSVSVLPYACSMLGCLHTSEGVLLICESLGKSRAKKITNQYKSGVDIAEFDENRDLVNIIKDGAYAATKFTCY